MTSHLEFANVVSSLTPRLGVWFSTCEVSVSVHHTLGHCRSLLMHLHPLTNSLGNHLFSANGKAEYARISSELTRNECIKLWVGFHMFKSTARLVVCVSMRSSLFIEGRSITAKLINSNLNISVRFGRNDIRLKCQVHNSRNEISSGHQSSR